MPKIRQSAIPNPLLSPTISPSRGAKSHICLHFPFRSLMISMWGEYAGLSAMGWGRNGSRLSPTAVILATLKYSLSSPIQTNTPHADVFIQRVNGGKVNKTNSDVYGSICQHNSNPTPSPPSHPQIYPPIPSPWFYTFRPNASPQRINCFPNASAITGM